MAAQTVRTKQRATAVQRLIDASNDVAAKLGVEPADIPTSHRDNAYLPTLQIEAVAGLLERIAGTFVAPPEESAPVNSDAPAIVTDESGTVIGEASPAKSKRSRT